MTSLLNQSGLNFQNGNPLGRKVRALESLVETLQKEVAALKSGGVAASASSAASVPTALTADVDALKRDMAMIKLAGFGKGEKGDKGDKGDRGEPGPMTYIAMPSNAGMPMMAPASVPMAPSVSST
jgi:hypothetical protein